VTPPVVHVASGREWRGGQRQVWLLARELHSRGIAQVVVTTTGSELARRLLQSGVPVQSATWRAGLDPRVIPPILQRLRPPALLHAHDAHALSLGAACALWVRCPFVATRRVTFPLRRQFFWRRACRIITISTAVRDALVRDGLHPSKLVLIPSAVDPAAAVSQSVDLRTRLGLPGTGQVALAVGALTPEKDHSTLVMAAGRLVRDLPALHWVIVGEGPLQYRLQRQIAQHGLADRVHLLGGMDDPHCALAGADVFVLSSSSEGLGSSVLAAMAAGVPVVATRVGGVPDLLGSGRGVLVEPGNPAQLADAVHRVLRDPGWGQSLVRTARSEIGRFSVGAMADQVLSVYRSCAHSIEGS
jgi:glycosyltransferase involved in cell wall biosynthesis